jgi:Histidine kinase-, DNA gyrase B-, and HSP90-like ATPase
MADGADKPFQFEISLSVLNHLGRNLYRNFITVLGEAISNAWDADAENVHIIVTGHSSDFIIKDDGIGMDASDFQGKFLKIGYSKRKEGETLSASKKRPFIGAKGIGKLALLSCSDVVSIISKKNGENYVGGTISNSDLDEAITNEVSSSEYALGPVNMKRYGPFLDDHDHGTIIDFIGTKEDVKGNINQIRKLIALYFRFALIDASFKIFLNGKQITLEDISDLSKSTQFLWIVNGFIDPIFDTFTNLEKFNDDVKSDLAVRGFIASVKFPKNLKIQGTDEKIGIDLFVNGRLREKDIMKHVPTARITESYLYGQIHFDELDGDGVDRFTSSREGVLASDAKYQQFLAEMKKNIIPKVLAEWDQWRGEAGEDGDDEAGGKTEKQRRAARLFQLSAHQYTSGASGKEKDMVDKWIDSIRTDAEFNIPAYADCYLIENLTRIYIEHNKIDIDDEIIDKSKKFIQQEEDFKKNANLSIEIRQRKDFSGYLDFNDLSFTVENVGKDWSKASLTRDAVDYRPIRNAVGHTGLLTDQAKSRLNGVFANVSGRLRVLLRGQP